MFRFQIQRQKGFIIMFILKSPLLDLGKLFLEKSNYENFSHFWTASRVMKNYFYTWWKKQKEG